MEQVSHVADGEACVFPRWCEVLELGSGKHHSSLPVSHTGRLHGRETCSESHAQESRMLGLMLRSLHHCSFLTCVL